MKRDIIWATITKVLVITYVTIGGGQQLFYAYKHHHVESSFLFAFLSGSIFVGRIGYGYYSGAKKTIIADIYGLVVLWLVAATRLYFDGF